MEILGIILLVLTCVALIILYAYCGVSTGLWAHTFLMLYFNSRKTLRRIVKPDIIVKANNVDYYWEKSDFGDFKTRWKLIDQSKRDYKTLEIYFDKYGNITYLKDDRWVNNFQILKDVCHDGLDLKSIIKNR